MGVMFWLWWHYSCLEVAGNLQSTEINPDEHIKSYDRKKLVLDNHWKEFIAHNMNIVVWRIDHYYCETCWKKTVYTIFQFNHIIFIWKNKPKKTTFVNRELIQLEMR